MRGIEVQIPGRRTLPKPLSSNDTAVFGDTIKYTEWCKSLVLPLGSARFEYRCNLRWF
jgi:hypothetical protein